VPDAGERKWPAPAEDGLSWEEGTRRVGDLFERVGFAPRLVDDAATRHLELDACPFRDLAKHAPRSSARCILDCYAAR